MAEAAKLKEEKEKAAGVEDEEQPEAVTLSPIEQLAKQKAEEKALD